MKANLICSKLSVTGISARFSKLHPLLIFFFISSQLIFINFAAQAETYTWNVSSGAWNKATNWSPEGVPGNGDNVNISNGGTVDVNEDVSVTDFSLVDGYIIGSGNLEVAGNFTWNSGKINRGGFTIITGQLFQEGPDDKILGEGTLILTGEGWLYDGNFLIGAGAKFSISAGGVYYADNSAPLYIGEDSNSLIEITEGSALIKLAGSADLNITGQVLVSGNNPSSIEVMEGSLLFDNISSGNFDNCTFAIGDGASVLFNGGTHSFGKDILLQGSGELVINGSTLIFKDETLMTCTGRFESGSIGGSGDLTVGSEFTWLGGTVNSVGSITFTDLLNIDGTGVKKLASGTVKLSGNGYWKQGNIGIDTGAIFRLEGSGKFYIQHTSTGILGSSANGTVQLYGQMIKSQSSTTTVGCQMIIGTNGLFNLNAGTLLFPAGSSMNCGGIVKVAPSAILKFSGSNHKFTGAVSGNQSGFGLVSVTGGTVNFMTGSSLTTHLDISGGTLSATSNLKPRNYNQSGGEFGGDGSPEASGSLTWSSGTLSGTGVFTVKGTSTFLGGSRNISTKTLKTTGNAEWLGGNFTFSNNATLHVLTPCVFSINHGTSCFVTGTGSLINDGIIHNMYGSTSIGTGVTCINNGLINGNGTMDFNYVMNYQLISPGFSPGKITVGGFDNSNGTLEMEIQEQTTPGTDYDQLEVQDSGTFSGTIEVYLLNGFEPPVGSEYHLITCSVCSGTFATVDLSAAVLPSGRVWVQDYTAGFTLKVEAALPVELIDFQVIANKNVAVLTWRTLSEKQNLGFGIERSYDGRQWTKVAFVESAGTNEGIKTYHFEDLPPLPGLLYYRLRQTDTDGTEEFSPVRSILMNEARERQLNVYPNPSRLGSNLTVFLPENELDEGMLQVYDLTGAKIFTQRVSAGMETCSIPGNVLKKGLMQIVYISKSGVIALHHVVD